jgi:hypothetical protein
MEALAGVLKPCGCAGMKVPAGVLKPVGCASMEVLAGKKKKCKMTPGGGGDKIKKCILFCRKGKKKEIFVCRCFAEPTQEQERGRASMI